MSDEHRMSAEDVEIRAVKLRSFLRTLGVDIPFRRRGGEPVLEWLIRGQSDCSMVKDKGLVVNAQKGEWGKQGVFFCDNLSPIPVDGTTLYIIVKSSGYEWLSYEGPKYKEWFRDYAQKNGLSGESISDCVEAESYMFNKFNVFQSDNGICTFHGRFDLTRADLVLISNRANVLEGDINPLIADKVVRFNNFN